MRTGLFQRLSGFFFHVAELTGLPRMRIFLQVMIIIVLMVIFQAFQGAFGVRIINSMQKKTDAVYSRNLSRYSNLSQIRLQLEQLRRHYLAAVASASDSPVPFDESGFQIKLYQLAMSDREREDLIRQAETIGGILGQANSLAGFAVLDRRLARIESSLDAWEENASGMSLSDLTNTRFYSQWAATATGSIAIISGLLSLLVGLAIAASISRPLQAIVAAANSLAAGNLTARIEAVGSAETREAVGSLNRAIDDLRLMVGHVNDQSETLLQASEELRQASLENGTSAAQVAKAMEELSKATTEQTNQVAKAVETIDRLAGLVRKVTMDTEGLAEASEKLTLSAQLGKKATDQIADGMDKIVESTREFAKVIAELSEASTQINEVTATIAGIAEQTTLLALNAEIEAARAGEQGKGFEVIAAQTAHLSERSKEAALLIENITQQMGARMDSTIRATGQAVSQVEVGQRLTNEASVTFQRIFEELAGNKRQIDEVAAFARMTARDNEEVLQAITAIAAISEEAMASTQDISAIAEEQSAATEQVSDLASNLNRIAEGLKRAVAAFAIRE